jgi:hypothetical protein
MQEVLMVVSAVPRRSSQLRLFARPQCNPYWTELSSDVQQKSVRLLSQLLKQHRGKAAEEIAKEAHGE